MVRTPGAREDGERAVESVGIQVAALEVTVPDGKGSAAMKDAGVIEEDQIARLQPADY
jgi:hypothetical protein